MTAGTAPMPCDEAIELLWDLLDGGLPDVDRAALDRHLARCLRCCGELAFAEHLRATLRERSGASLPADARERLESFIDDLFAPSAEDVT